jgi:aryl-alcohol dehydrogenase-like predicted oxidoreductase/spore coat polysaccharide biosynthesis protein SpsF (cytidylyltransferase family)
VLLPLAGLPMAVLCARRAATTGRSVMLAIPEGADDDPLAAAAAAHGVTFRRGALDDVLSRFMAAIEDLDDDAVVVRLTADNPFPDGSFVDFAIKTLLERGSAYVGPEFGEGRFPHGLSGEAFRAGALRSVERAATGPLEREHVTTALRQRVPDRLSASAVGIPRAAGLVSCSIDRGRDYVAIRNLFESVDDPIAEPWRALLDRFTLGAAPPEFQVGQRLVLGVRTGEMSLGTAQLGMAYGIANRTGQPDRAAAADIIATARMCGVTHFDTARMYGDSERILGEALAPPSPVMPAVTVVTKLPAFPRIERPAGSTVRDWVRQMAETSATELRRSTVDVLLLHRWQDRERESGSVWRAMCDLRSEGIIGVLGASVQNVDEAVAALLDPDVRHVQLPVNVLDWRWRSPEFREARAARPDVAVHARSSLLQGLLVMSPNRWPVVDGMSAAEIGERLGNLVKDCDRSSVADLAFAYVRSLAWVDTVVVGAEAADQVIANVELFRRPPLTEDEANDVADSLPKVPEVFLNPALWPSATN